MVDKKLLVLCILCFLTSFLLFMKIGLEHQFSKIYCVYHFDINECNMGVIMMILSGFWGVVLLSVITIDKCIEINFKEDFKKWNMKVK